MLRRRGHALAMTVALLVAAAGMASAQPFNPPTWWENPGNYYVKYLLKVTWDPACFPTKASEDTTKRRTGGMQPSLPATNNYAWSGKDAARVLWGINWDGDLRILTLDVGNEFRAGLTKDIFVSWKFSGVEAKYASSPGLTLTWPPDKVGKTPDPTTGTDDTYAWSHWSLTPQPRWERLEWRLGQNEHVEEIWVGTRCHTPELPTTVLVACSCLLAVLWGRRRR